MISRQAGALPTLAYGPLFLEKADRPVPMEVRVTTPASGENLPVVLFSHGHGASNFLSSVRGYAPLVEFWAAHGFIVIQVTHLDSRMLALDADGPEGATFWRSRATDISALIDQLPLIEALVPGLTGRMDRSRIGVAGHSLGGQTVTLLCGAQMTDPATGKVVDLTEPRISAAIAMGPPGDGKDLAEHAATRYPELAAIDLATMDRPALVLVGDQDFSTNFSPRHDWRRDAFSRAPGPKTLAMVFGGDHMLGGISGWDAAETSRQDPELLGDVQRLTLAYLSSALRPDDTTWTRASRDFEARGIGRIENK